VEATEKRRFFESSGLIPS